MIAQIVKLRAERAALLGYRNHAAYVLEDETALTPDAVNNMLSQLAPPAVANAKREAADMQQLIDAQAKANGTASFKLEPWDWDFYAEQVRKARYSYDESQVRPYFEMNRVLRDGVLFAAHELYGLNFKERKDLPMYQPDVRVFEVFDADGSQLGPVPGRLVRAQQQARRCLDEQLRRTVAPARHEAGRRQQPQHPEAAGRASRRCSPSMK